VTQPWILESWWYRIQSWFALLTLEFRILHTTWIWKVIRHQTQDVQWPDNTMENNFLFYDLPWSIAYLVSLVYLVGRPGAHGLVYSVTPGAHGLLYSVTRKFGFSLFYFYVLQRKRYHPSKPKFPMVIFHFLAQEGVSRLYKETSKKRCRRLSGHTKN
jgi:hypothetical protein